MVATHGAPSIPPRLVADAYICIGWYGVHRVYGEGRRAADLLVSEEQCYWWEIDDRISTYSIDITTRMPETPRMVTR